MFATLDKSSGTNPVRPVSSSHDSRWTILRSLFDFFEREQLAYVVLGDYYKTRDERDGDVDIAVDTDGLRLLPRLLVRFAAMVDAQLVQCIRHESTAYFFVLAWQDADGSARLLQIDACSDYRRSGRTLIEYADLLEGRRLIDVDGAKVRVPSPEAGLAYYLAKKVEKGTVDEYHGEWLHHTVAELENRTHPVLVSLFGASWAERILEMIELGDLDTLNEVLPALGKVLHSKRPVSRGSAVREGGRRLKRIISQTGFHVVVLGPDGAGKSTVIDAIRDELQPAFWGTDYFHLRPRLGTGVVHGEGAVDDPHALPPRGVLVSALKLCYYVADYVVGYASVVKPRLLRSHLVVFDRYYHDILADPRRYRLRGVRWFSRLLGRAVPGPDLYLFLDAPAPLIQQRKSEVTVEETERQLTAYRELASRLKPSVVIDASAPIESVRSSAVAAVLDRMAIRTEKRFWLR